MRVRIFFLTVLSLLFTLAIPVYAQYQFEPLPIDPKVKYGKLDNGLTYYIRSNSQPKERADFYIVQNVGSILEEENQRGLAHFLEHMAFAGLTHFPDEGISKFTERIGVRFGENLNAYTGFDETVYMIKNVPVTDPASVDSCLLILHDWSGFLSLEDDAIEKERGVIREEWRSRQDAQARIWEQQLPRLYPDNRYAYRLPIGTIDVIDNFKPDELRDYYKKWYRPDLQAIIIVGDIDAAEIENKVHSLFADIPAPVNPAEREWFGVADNEKPLISIATDKEATSTLLHIMHKYDKYPDEVMASIDGLVINYIKRVASSMLNERLEEIVQKADPPFIDAGTFDGDFVVSKTKGAWTIAALVKDNRIEDAMNALVMETERIKQFGFTAAEYERARINLLKNYETAFNERDSQRNGSYTQAYVSHFTDGGAIPGIELTYQIISEIAPQITVENVNEYIHQVVGDTNIAISITGPETDDIIYPAETDLLQMYLQAREIPVEPYVEEFSDEPLLTELPEPGTIISSIEDEHFGATVMQLSNGIKVILKHTEFKNDEIRMTATSPGGTILFGPEDYANLKVINEVISLGGLGNFSNIDLSKVLAGKNVSCSTSLGISDENVNGFSVPADIETLFQLIYLNFTAKRKDQEAFDSYVTRMKSYLVNQELDPMVAFSDSLIKVVYNNNPRVQRIRIEDFNHISYDRIMEMYRERFSDASDFVFTFVGNLDEEIMKPLIERYLANLPALNRTDKPNEQLAPRIQQGVHINHFKRTMETPKATVLNMFPGNMDYNIKNNITATMLKQILDLVYTEKIRKDEGGTYGVGVNMVISWFPKGQAYLQTFFDTDPEKHARMSEILHEELQRIVDEGPRIDDFNKTKENMLKRYAENQEENSYWLNALDLYYYRGYDAVTDYLKTLESITLSTVQSFLKELLDQQNRIEIVMSNE
ncbi:MAG: insulinase family protein [Tannerellaceae bacterium]|nr:insulinase family protein [Tannerellaceae bacterium]